MELSKLVKLLYSWATSYNESDCYCKIQEFYNYRTNQKLMNVEGLNEQQTTPNYTYNGNDNNEDPYGRDDGSEINYPLEEEADDVFSTRPREA